MAKNINLNLKTDEPFMERLIRASEVLDRPYARIVRQAVNEKLDEYAEEYPELAAENFYDLAVEEKAA